MKKQPKPMKRGSSNSKSPHFANVEDAWDQLSEEAITKIAENENLVQDLEKGIQQCKSIAEQMLNKYGDPRVLK